jgi:hypothetical protein
MTTKILNQSTVTDTEDAILLASKIKLAFGESVSSNRTKNREITWDELAGLVGTPDVGEKDGPYFCRGIFSGNVRSDEKLPKARLLIFEVDHGLNLESGEVLKNQGPHPELVHTFLKGRGISHLIFTTYSSQKQDVDTHRSLEEAASSRAATPKEIAAIEVPVNGYKYRVICSISRSIDRGENKILIQHMFESLQESGIAVATAEESWKWAQPWYLPRVPCEAAKEKFKFFRFDGACLDVDSCLEVAKTTKSLTTSLRPFKLQKEARLKSKQGPFSVDKTRVIQAVNGDAAAIRDCVDHFYGNPHGFAELLRRHGYEQASGSDVRWKKPGSNQPPGVNVFQREDGGWLLASHHQNDPLHDDEQSAIDYMSAFIRLECSDVSKLLQYSVGLRKLRELLLTEDSRKAEVDRCMAPNGQAPEAWEPKVELLTPESALTKLVWIEHADQVLHLEHDKVPVPMKVAKNKYAASIYEEVVGNKVKAMPVLDIWLRHPSRLSYEVTGFVSIQRRNLKIMLDKVFRSNCLILGSATTSLWFTLRQA